MDRSVVLEFKIDEQTQSHLFYVVNNINRNVMLGRDFLQQHGVRLYFDLEYLQINHSYISIEDDGHIASIVRLQRTTVLRTQTINIIIK